MDEVEVDIQVLFPTIFINQVAERADIDVAICRGFNRWMADITKDAGAACRGSVSRRCWPWRRR